MQKVINQYFFKRLSVFTFNLYFQDITLYVELMYAIGQ